MTPSSTGYISVNRAQQAERALVAQRFAQSFMKHDAGICARFMRSDPFFGADQADESVFQVGDAGAPAQVGRRALGHRMALGDDDHVVAQVASLPASRGWP